MKIFQIASPYLTALSTRAYGNDFETWTADSGQSSNSMTSMGLCASRKEKEVNIFQVYEHQSTYAYIYEHQVAYKGVGSVVLA